MWVMNIEKLTEIGSLFKAEMEWNHYSANGVDKHGILQGNQLNQNNCCRKK